MKTLLLIPAVLFGLWSAYWVAGKNVLVGALDGAKSELSEDGIALSTKEVKVTGYPMRYQAVLSDVNVSGTNGSYQAELININASALKPTVWTLSADAPARIQFTGKDGQDYDFILAGEDMRVELGSSIAGKLKSIHVTMRGLKAVAAAGGLAPPIIGIENGEISISPTTAPLQGGMNAVFDISGVTLADKAGGDLQRAFGPYVGRIQGTGVAAGLASLDADDIAIWENSGGVTVPDFAMDWGKVSFHGAVDLDMRTSPATGKSGANGAATLGVSDADALIQSFVQAGMLTQGQAIAGSFLLMAAPTDEKGRIVLTFPVVDNALTLFGQTLHKF